MRLALTILALVASVIAAPVAAPEAAPEAAPVAEPEPQGKYATYGMFLLALHTLSIRYVENWATRLTILQETTRPQPLQLEAMETTARTSRLREVTALMESTTRDRRCEKVGHIGSIG